MKGILDSRQLLAFSTLARLGSFTATAKELFLTQSAVSHAIKALEIEVGVRLFDRIGKRAHLTQAGEQLLHHVEKVLREMQDARNALERLQNWGHGRLRIGASMTACQYLLPGVLREFRRKYPSCTIRVEPGDAPEVVEALRANRIDVAVMLKPAAGEEVSFRPLFEDDMNFLVPPQHPWAIGGRVQPGEVCAQTFILYSKASYTFRMVSDYFDRENIVLQNFMELGSIEAIKELVKIGLGVAVLAPWTARKELLDGALVPFPLGDRPLRRVWGVSHLRGRRLTLAEETFIDLCGTEAAALDLRAAA